MNKEAKPGAVINGIKAVTKALNKHPDVAIPLTTAVGGTGAYYSLKGLGALGRAAGRSQAKDLTGVAAIGSPSDKYNQGSYLNTLNPISGVTGGVDKVPGWWANMFPGSDAGRRAAHLTFKSSAVALLAAALVGGYRTMKHYAEMEDLEDADRPGKDLASQLSTTFEGDLSGERKKASVDNRVKAPAAFTVNNALGTTLPMGAALLSAALMYKAVDDHFDAQRNKALSESITAKEDAIKQLITARAQIAKGADKPKAVDKATTVLDNDDIYVKDAALHKEALIGQGVQAFGTLTAAVILASAIGAYAYTSASDKSNLQYKAYKKALKDYAKAKSGITPITVAPSDAANYFTAIDAAAKDKKTTAREQPAYNPDNLNQPISVSF